MTASPRTCRANIARRSAPGVAILCAWIFLAAISGCGKDNPVKPQIQQPKYLPSSTPQNTLENLRRAYTSRDSMGYDSLFDGSYTGSSIDQSGPSPVMLTFTKGDEARHIGSLARTVSISSIALQFPPALSRFRDAGDPPGWETVDMSSMRLEIDDNSTSLDTGSNELIEFKFKPTSPSPGSPTDTTWKIIQWIEVKP